jgi:diaminohydroxyphosphoribosylaminopyrimidine deaminase/5-amino-6-(5-phosphoribosylamino)uracil reductase
MARAAELGRAVRRAASPNPGVGCVIEARDGRVFEGATEPPGARHAEIVALDAAGDAARGATVWVTLEPCAHTGRTGPCADALIAAGVDRVVVGISDPDPHVAGRGLSRLVEAGVTIKSGVMADEIAHDLRAYLTHRRLGRSYVTLKLAMTIDGRTVSDDPSTQWLTGPDARADGHRLRASHDAILVGAHTVRVDNPRLTTRDAPGPDPVRVVLGHAPPGAAVHPCLERSGDIAEVLRGLAAEGITSLLVEGGAHTAREFHDAGLVDEYVLYVALAEPHDAAPAMAAMWDADVVDAMKIDNDVRVTLVPRPR